MRRAGELRCDGHRHRVRRFIIVISVLRLVDHADLAQKRVVGIEGPQGVEGTIPEFDLGLVHQFSELQVRGGLVHRRESGQCIDPEVLVLNGGLAEGVYSRGIVEVGQGLGAEEADLRDWGS